MRLGREARQEAEELVRQLLGPLHRQINSLRLELADTNERIEALQKRAPKKRAPKKRAPKKKTELASA